MQLMRSAALPGRGAVPAMNFRTMRHRGQVSFMGRHQDARAR
jgi:hypothetical protein